MLGVRPLVVGRFGQGYLVWNLVLAWVPFLLALAFYDRAKGGRVGAAGAAVGAAWLLFLPNAPYIVTDLIHLPERAAPPVWFDVTLYLAFAWTGLLLGLAALYLVHTAIARLAGAVAGWIVAVGALALSGVGIYLGRVLRWNSWDVVTNPSGVLRALAAPLLDPDDHTLAIVAALTMSCFLACAYLVTYSFVRMRLERPVRGE